MRIALLFGLLVACTSPDHSKPTTCVPMTCDELGVHCGAHSDGCDNSVACGSCASGFSCNASGHCDANPCTHKTCADLGAECGTPSDGCGGTLSCGSCWPGDACDNNVCVCVPYCGTHQCGDDGCGGSCGSCGVDETCSSSWTCVSTGHHTPPPPAWHCNATYWDAGDGCDCNCGALDPDCGIPNAHLLGCTGLNSPTCNTQGLCTGGGSCNATPGSSYLTYYEVIGTAPTMLGGTVLAGRYEATDITSYNHPGGVSGYHGGSAYAIEITGTTWKMVTRPVGGYPNVDENFTATPSGTTVSLARSCPTTLTKTLGYTAGATTLKLARTYGTSVEVTTFTKRW